MIYENEKIIEDMIMNQYEKLTSFLANVFDTNHEFTVLDLRPEHSCITAIANGHNSGRQVGAPITDLALNLIKEQTWKKQSSVCNYVGVSGENTLVSSSFFITFNDKLLGMFCINISKNKSVSLEQIYKDISELSVQMRTLLPQYSETDIKNMGHSLDINETFTNSLEERLNQAISKCIPTPGIPLERLTQDEKVSIVENLNDMGFFLIKGAVSETAKHLNCSDATIYRYMSKLEKKRI